MATYVTAFVVMLIAGVGMAAGLLLRGRELKGSCGGLSAMQGVECPVCGGQAQKCEDKKNTGGRALP